MIINLKLKPYAESEKNGNIDTFDEEEWDLICDLFERLIRNFKKAYPKVNVTKLETLRKPYIYINIQKEEFLEEELDYYIEILSGFNDENIIFFDDIKYVIRSNLEENFLEKFNNLALDIAPDLIEK